MKLLILQTRNKSWPKFEPLFTQAAKDQGVDLALAKLKDIKIVKDQEVKILIGEQDLTDFDAIYLRYLGSFLEEAAWVGEYARQKDLLLYDRVYKQGRDSDRKSFECLRLTAAGASYPQTFIGDQDYLLSQADSLGWPLILKKTDGRKSEQVYKVSSLDSFKKLLKNYVKEDRLIIQKFIDNDYYLRFTVVGGEVVGAMKRNKSMGSGVGVQSINYQPTQDQINLAVLGAKALNIDIAGVDMMVDKQGQAYILEVNRSPQYRVFMDRTGVDVPEKIIEFFVREFKQKSS